MVSDIGLPWERRILDEDILLVRVEPHGDMIKILTIQYQGVGRQELKFGGMLISSARRPPLIREESCSLGLISRAVKRRSRRSSSCPHSPLSSAHAP